MERSNLSIEFFGLPGAGKTFLTKKLADKYDCYLSNNEFKAYYNNIKYYSKLIHFFVFLIANIKMALISLIYALTVRPLNLYSFKRSFKLLKIAFIISLFKKWSSKNNANKIIIFDQAMIQAIWSISIKGSSSSRAVLSKLLREADRWISDKAVFVIINPQKAVKRLAARDEGTIFEKINAKKTFKLLKQSNGFFNYILDILSSKNIIYIDGDGDISNNINDIHDHIRSEDK